MPESDADAERSRSEAEIASRDKPVCESIRRRVRRMLTVADHKAFTEKENTLTAA